MCWVSNNKPIIKIATEDIPVFKIVLQENKELESYYTRFKYQIGKTYIDELEDPIEIAEIEEYIIKKGFHSYSSNKCIIELSNRNGNKAIRIKSSLYLDTYCDGSSIKANCAIPKESFYYVNEYGEYVSDQIKIINIEHVLDKL